MLNLATNRIAELFDFAMPESGYWLPIRDGHLRGFEMYRRHYSSAKSPHPQIRQFVGPGQKMVLLGRYGDALWAWRKFIDDSGQTGVNCAIFRNESLELSSKLILEAMEIGWQRWPAERFYTYVDASSIQSLNPGYCFLKAGWNRCGKTKSGKLILEFVKDRGQEC